MEEIKDDSLEVLVARIDERQKALSDIINEIKNNHLAHISAEIKSIQNKQERTDLKIAYWSGGVGFLVIIIQILLYHFKF